jgi:hypothetical protein
MKQTDTQCDGNEATAKDASCYASKRHANTIPSDNEVNDNRTTVTHTPTPKG